MCCNAVGNVFRLCIIGGCLFSLTLQFFNLYSCDFFTFLDSGDSIGIWYESDTIVDGEVTCSLDEPYPFDDPLVSAARSAAILSMLCGLVAMLLVSIEWICCEICCASCVEGLAFVGAWGCGLAVYAIYGIPECGDLANDLAGGNSTIGNIAGDYTPEGIPTGANCEWGQGATYNIMACGSYLLCGIVLCCAPAPEPLCRQAKD